MVPALIAMIGLVIALSTVLNAIAPRFSTSNLVLDIANTRVLLRQEAQTIIEYAVTSGDYALSTAPATTTAKDSFGTTLSRCIHAQPGMQADTPLTGPSAIAASIISAGPDKVVQTTCAHAGSSNRDGDDIVWGVTAGDMFLAQRDKEKELPITAIGYAIQ